MAKCTSPKTSEYTGVCRAVERSKEILNHVNQAVREAEDRHRLAEIQKRLDRTAFDKADHQASGEFKVLHFDQLFFRFNLSNKLLHKFNNFSICFSHLI